PGKWTLQVQPAGSAKQSVVTATLGAGNVYSLLVLDSPNGGLTGQLRIDARRQGGVPLGAVDTGAGGTAQRNTTPVLIGAAVAVLLGGGLVTAWLFTVRRRRLRPQRL
ncbi:MAG TPA: DUF4397 domain-containing protein, partial [Micromonosporaceae bacterium]|nr:DUF4397 domain-containing protein [Micromonosporaceae bacterium]